MHWSLLCLIYLIVKVGPWPCECFPFNRFNLINTWKLHLNHREKAPVTVAMTLLIACHTRCLQWQRRITFFKQWLSLGGRLQQSSHSYLTAIDSANFSWQIWSAVTSQIAAAPRDSWKQSLRLTFECFVTCLKIRTLLKGLLNMQAMVTCRILCKFEANAAGPWP